MPAGFTHMTLSRIAVDKVLPQNHSAVFLLKKELGAYINGSVAPDIPYMSPFDDLNPFDNQDHIADTIHAHDTMTIPYAGLREAKKHFQAGKVELAQAFFAYYLGYLSHVVLDGFTHPFIRDRVGDYGPKTKVAHRDLEMKIDVLVLDHFLGQQANGVSPQEDLSLFEDCAFQDEIFEFYSQKLKEFHSKTITGPKLKKLSAGMSRALSIAEGRFPKWYSLASKDRGISYMNLSEVKKEEVTIRTLEKAIDGDEKGILYNSISNVKIDVFDDVFPKYLAFFPKVIAGVYEFVFTNGEKLEELVPAINMDTGRPLASTSLRDKPALWELV